MKVQPGEFVLVQGVGNTLRPRLVKFLQQDGKECTGYLDIPNKEDDSKSISFELRDIVANIGKYPKAGSIYGVKIEPLIRTIKDKQFKEIRVYQKLKDEQLDRLLNELKDFYSDVKQKGHHKIPYHIEVRNPQGKYAGYYKYLPKAEFDILCIKPEKNLEGLQYLLSHEHAHGLYWRRCNARTRNSWVKMYHKYIALSEASEEDLSSILEEIQGVGHIGDYLKEADEETKAIVKACLRYIGQVHGIGKHHLDTALSLQESIEEYWPTSSLDFSEKEIIVSDYARKNPEELFAEASAFNFLGRPLPKKVQTLLDRTYATLTV
jgi:hypothetical protein